MRPKHRKPRGGDNCDFCAEMLVARLYACRNFRWDDHEVFTHTIGRWAACAACSELIDAQAWTRLANRVMARVAQRQNLTVSDIDVLRKDLRLMYATLRVHLVPGEVLFVMQSGGGKIIGL
jgi:hypothetical protein